MAVQSVAVTFSWHETRLSAILNCRRGERKFHCAVALKAIVPEPPLTVNPLILRSDGAFRFLAAALIGSVVALTLAYILPRSFGLQDDAMDLRLIWVAGKIWAHSGNPYSSSFENEYQAYLSVPAPIQHFWVYPPHWYLIATTLGSKPLTVAVMDWKYCNFAMLVTGTLLAARSLSQVFDTEFWKVFILGFVIVCCMWATASAIALGQTSILIYFGVGLLLYGIAFDNSVILIIGLLVTTLKPNFGLPFVLMAAMLGRWRAALVSIAMAGILSLFGQAPFIEQIKSFASNLHRYGNNQILVNQPPDMTGIGHIANYVFHATIPPAALMALALVITLIVCHHREPQNARQNVVRCLVTISTVLMLVPLHTYDMVLVAIPGMSMLTTRHRSRWLLLTGMVLAERSGNLARITGFAHPLSENFVGSLIESIAVTVIWIGTVWSWWASLKSSGLDDAKARQPNGPRPASHARPSQS